MRCAGPTATLLVTLLLFAAVAHAKAWNGIEPGVSRRDEVVKRFGPASKITVSARRFRPTPTRRR
jgi:hypothetical protein